MYVGYMYGTSNETAIDRSNSNNSTIKSAIDKWYVDNLNTNYGKYLSTTAVYCNDREIGKETYSETGDLIFYFAPYTRLAVKNAPTYDCTNISDAFSVSNTSAKLNYPIGLMTADEVSFAGGLWYGKAPAYYYRNSSSASTSSTGLIYWWTMTPSNWNGSSSGMFSVFGSDSPGYLGDSGLRNTFGVRPVISLKSCVKYGDGDGSADSPYTIDESYEC